MISSSCFKIMRMEGVGEMSGRMALSRVDFSYFCNKMLLENLKLNKQSQIRSRKGTAEIKGSSVSR